MKGKKTILSVVAGILLIFAVAGCTDKPNDDKGRKDITDLYTVVHNEDNTYSYTFTDLNGTVLFEEEKAAREPRINQITATVYELKTQSGTGLSTNWAVYCDVENSKVSEIFYYVLGAQGNYVVSANYEDGKHFITVQNIFDKSAYYKTYELENVSPVAADFALGCEFENESKATITYLVGEDYDETEMTITIP